MPTLCQYYAKQPFRICTSFLNSFYILHFTLKLPSQMIFFLYTDTSALIIYISIFQHPGNTEIQCRYVLDNYGPYLVIWTFYAIWVFFSHLLQFRPFVLLRLIWALLGSGIWTFLVKKEKGKIQPFWDLWANLASLATMPQYGRHTHGLDGSVPVGVVRLFELDRLP